MKFGALVSSNEFNSSTCFFIVSQAIASPYRGMPIATFLFFGALLRKVEDYHDDAIVGAFKSVRLGSIFESRAGRRLCNPRAGTGQLTALIRPGNGRIQTSGL